MREHMNCGRGIQWARECAGLSKRALVAAAGFDQSYVGLVESGKRRPSVDALEKVAEATRVSLRSLLLACLVERKGHE